MCVPNGVVSFLFLSELLEHQDFGCAKVGKFDNGHRERYGEEVAGSDKHTLEGVT
jgi:hypothetical protein